MINKDFFAGNRSRLMRELGDGGALWLTAYDSMQHSADMAAIFCQESNFWYLTGVSEPGWQLLCIQGESILIAPDISESERVFDGFLSNEKALDISGCDRVVGCKEAGELRGRLKSVEAVYTLGEDPYSGYYSFFENPAPGRLRGKLEADFSGKIRDVRQLLAKLRAIKQPMEIEAIRRAVILTADAFNKVKSNLAILESENQVEAIFGYEFRCAGASYGYDPIVASGMNACTLHYNKNSATWSNGELVLIDIGAKLDGYSADITRTYATGSLTDRQRQVHEAVKAAHLKIIDLVKPGLGFREYQNASDEIMRQTLSGLGLMKDSADFRKYFPHAISHGLGVDVHDSLGGFEVFMPGMIITVEPGIYIPEESIGVRLEDNILVTDTVSENLSAALSLEL